MVFKYMINYSSNCPDFRAQYVSCVFKVFIMKNFKHTKIEEYNKCPHSRHLA